MVSKENITDEYRPDDLEAILSLDSLAPAEKVVMRTAVAEIDFDPNDNPELTRKILLKNDNLANRIICSHPLLDSGLRLMVIKKGLRGDLEALLRPEEALQRAAIERGGSRLLDIVAEHPDLSGELQSLLLTKCFVLKKKRYSFKGIYDDSTIHFAVIHKLRQHPDYDRRLDDQLVKTLLQTQQGESHYGLLHSFQHYFRGSELMFAIAGSPGLEKSTWQELTKVILERTVLLSGILGGGPREEYKPGLEKMLNLVIDTLLESLNSPVLADIHPSLRLEEVIKGGGPGDAAAIAFGDLRYALSNLDEERKQAFARLDSERQELLPRGWKRILLDRD